MKKLQIVGVMGSGRKAWAEFAEPLGIGLAHLSVHLLTGGGDGVMRTVSRGFTSVKKREGLSLGCIPMNHQEDGSYSPHNKYPNPYIELPIYTPLGVYDSENPDEITRNHINVLTSDLVIALPGMGGTRNEISLAQKFKKSVLLYGPEEEFIDIEANIERTSKIDEAINWVQQKIAPQP